jgi:hypothetical protein
MNKRSLAVLLFIFMSLPLFSDESVVIRELIILEYDTGSWDIPPGAFDELSARLREVADGSGRFRLTRAAAGSDPSALTQEGIILRPVLDTYRLKSTGAAYEAELGSSVTLFDVRNGYYIARLSFRTIGAGPTPYEAVRSAAVDIPPQLDFELRNLEPFRGAAGILRIDDATLLLDFGRDMGLRRGDEFEVSGGEKRSLIIVRELQEKVAFADLLYGDPSLGDRLIEVPRLGFETLFYGRALIDRKGRILPAAGIQASWIRGTGWFKPLVGVETPSGGEEFGTYGIPVFAFTGFEMDWTFGRLQLQPMGALGVGGGIPISENQQSGMTHFGGLAQLQMKYLIGRDAKLFAAAGYATWTGLGVLEEELRYSYNGVTLGGGIVWKF